jgi:hypothetical protein
MSSATSVSDALEGYITGQVLVERVVAVVAAAYYRDTGNEKRETLRPLVEIIERAHPGVVELSASTVRPGFVVQLADRPFPKRYEAEFRQAVQALLATFPVSRVPFPEAAALSPSLLRRIVAAVRRLFSA